MLTAYENATQQLFQALTSPVPLIPLATIDGYINSARSQVAAEGECIRVNANFALTLGINSYSFSTATTNNTAAPTVLSLRSGRIVSGFGLDFRPYEWFAAYYLPGLSVTGTPTICAQQAQGNQGNVFFFPTPNGSFTARFDAIALPIALTSDSTIEALPYPWTDAVPFYAAWLCMLNAQRQADADMMFQRYETVMMRLARMGSTPSELPSNVPIDRGLQMRGGGQ